MRKTICILLTFAMLLTLFGCGKGPETSDPLTAKAPSSSVASLDLTSYDHTQYGHLLSDYPLPEDFG